MPIDYRSLPITAHPGSQRKRIWYKCCTAQRQRLIVPLMNINIFTWWNGTGLGTLFTTKFGATRVGEDSLGNVYYETRANARGQKRRSVMYKRANDASLVPPEWHGWLHGTLDDVPSVALPAPRAWQQPPTANLTGTLAAYKPNGAPEKGGRRASATGDYEAWSPDGDAV
jgi:NADH:ubiquinone oxidoreductase subunit